MPAGKGVPVRRMAVVLAAVLLAVLIAIFAVSAAGPPGQWYDFNESGSIEWNELETSARDYYEGELERDDALDMVLRYVGNVPVATPAPRYSEEPESPTPALIGDCETPRHGVFAGSLQVFSNELDITFVNPSTSGYWEYAAEWSYHPWRTYSVNPRLYTGINSNGEWFIKRNDAFGHERQPPAHRPLAELGIPFNAGEGERNRLTWTDTKFWVNGQLASTQPPSGFYLDIHYLKSRTWGSGSVPYQGVRQQYENLCEGPPH